MTQVEDSINWHEPYLYARRMGPDGPDAEKFKAMMTKMIEKMGVSREAMMAAAQALPYGYEARKRPYQWIKDQLEADAPGKKLIFCKDMVEGIVDKYDALPSGFRHTILLRHPAKVFNSFKKMVVGGWGPDADLRKIPDCGLMPPGYFYKELVDLLKHIRDNLDSNPIIICTDDLQRNPELMMKAYCKEMNIPFNDKLLNWEDDGDKIVAKWMVAKETVIGLNKVHANAFGSTGFGEPSPIPDVTSFDEDVREVIEKSMPFYEEMYKARLVVTE